MSPTEGVVFLDTTTAQKDVGESLPPRKGIFGTMVMLLVVVVPFLATGWGIRKLWKRDVFLSDLFLLGGMYFLTNQGVAVGLHRMMTHRAFVAHPVLKYVLLVCGTMALEMSAVDWGTIHGRHHAHSDTPKDPHDRHEGFWYTHFGWLFRVQPSDREKYGRHLIDDPIVMDVSKKTWLWYVLSFLIPFLLRGRKGLIWAGLIRICLVHHVTWSVNSICHDPNLSTKDPNVPTDDLSHNVPWLALPTGGESWHQNHHFRPRAAFHGFTWRQADIAKIVILSFYHLRLVDEVWVVDVKDQNKLKCMKHSSTPAWNRKQSA